MNIKRLFSVCLLFGSLNAAAQVTTFKDTRWFDYKTNTSSMYRKPVNQPATVVISADSIIASLGTTVHRFKVKSVTESPKSFNTKYVVDMDGQEKTIFVARVNEANMGGPDRLVAMINGYGEWYVFAQLTNIRPQGYLFPGEPKINIEEEKAKVAGYYEFMTLGFTRTVDLNKDGKFSNSYSDELNDCQRDILIDLGEDGTGSWAQGTTGKDCPKFEQAFTWKLEQVLIKGRRELMLFLNADLDSKQFIVKEVTKGRLVIKGEFRFGGDSTEDATLELSRKKKKKA
jgi:hypothetical protein